MLLSNVSSLFFDRHNCITSHNKCIGDDTKAAARQSLNCIKNKKKYNMAKNDFQYSGWNSYTLQCGMWLWNRDSKFTKWQHHAMWYVALGWHMPLNSPKRPPYCNSTSAFHFHTSPQSTCHSVPVCEILSWFILVLLWAVDVIEVIYYIHGPVEY